MKKRPDTGTTAVIIGSGNIAGLLAENLHRRGVNILQVYSRTPARARKLAARVKAEAVASPGELHTAADFYLIAVSDDAIAPVAEQLEQVRGIVLHTSGTTDMQVLKKKGRAYGVLYPLQTVSQKRKLDTRLIPFSIEASSPAALREVRKLAEQLSDKVIRMNSVQRRAAHLAAVFACNFTNHFYRIAADLLRSQGLRFDLLHPLIAETARKAQHMAPAAAQTGPALRGDRKTMAKHLELLKQHPEWAALYRAISTDIAQKAKK